MGARVCSIDEHKHKGNNCSHIKCRYAKTPTSAGKPVLTVDHDHREKHGGNHTCVYSTNPHIFLTIAPAYATVIVGKIRKDSNVKSTISAACLLYQTHDSSTRITTALHTPQQI